MRSRLQLAEHRTERSGGSAADHCLQLPLQELQWSAFELYFQPNRRYERCVYG